MMTTPYTTLDNFINNNDLDGIDEALMIARDLANEEIFLDFDDALALCEVLEESTGLPRSVKAAAVEVAHGYLNSLRLYAD